MPSGIAKNIIGKEHHSEMVIQEYTPQMEGLGREPKTAGESGWLRTIEVEIKQLANVGADDDFDMAGAVNEISTQVPIADFTSSHRITEISAFSLDIVESLNRPASQSVVSPDVDEGIIAPLNKQRDILLIQKLRNLATHQATPVIGGVLDFSRFLGNIISDAESKMLYDGNVERTLLVPARIYRELGLAIDETLKKRKIDILREMLWGLNIMMRPYPVQDHRCILIVDNALVRFSGRSACVKNEAIIDEYQEKRVRRYGFSTNGYYLSATIEQKPYAMMSFDWHEKPQK